MQNTQRFFLGKEERLKSRKAIALLFEEGRHFSNHPLKVFWMLCKNEKGMKAGFAAGSKNFKRAVDRNRIKRLLRESYRLQKHSLEKEDILATNGLRLFFIYSGKEMPEYKTIFEKTGAALKRIAKLVNENIQ